MTRFDGLVLGVVAAASVTGITLAAWILRWEIRYQRRQRRYGGFVGGAS